MSTQDVEAQDAGTQEFARQLLEAHERNAPYPQASKTFPDLDLDAAYAIQKQFVAALSARSEILGYKGALTAPRAQQNMGIDRPVTGALFARPGYDGGSEVPAAAFGRLMLETELSFRVARDIDAPLSTPEAAAAVIADVAPAVELANLSFAAPPAGGTPGQRSRCPACAGRVSPRGRRPPVESPS